MKYFIIINFILQIIVSSGLFARTALLSQEEVLVGTRPFGLSGAFVASADDVNSIGWNPAGLAFLKNNEIVFSVPLNPLWARDLDIGFNNFYGGVAVPITKKYTIGLDWLHIGYSDDPALNWNNKPELEYNEEKVSIAIARSFGKALKIGTSLKYYNMGVYYDGSVERKGNGLGMDIGFNYMLFSKFRIGLLVNNVFSAVMLYDNSESRTFITPSVRLGFVYSFVKNNNVELTFDDMVHLGVEYWLYNLIAIRGGVQKDILNAGEPISLSGGTGVRYWFLQLDYGITYNTYFKVSHNVSATYRFGYKSYLVEVLDFHVDDVFASLYKSYAKKDIISLKVKNKSKKPLKTKLGFYVEKYMDSPTETVVVLKPNIETSIKVPVVFNQDIMDRTDDGAISGKIIITYEHEKQKRMDESTKQFMLYSRNAFVWDELEKLAVFVTPQDETIKSFTRGIIQLKSENELEDELISDNFYYTMFLFSALGEYGMTYVIDPNTPFAEMSEMKNAIDYVQFPIETFKTKTGDCDDLTVLFASCLANIGIQCAFIDVPGHIYIMVNLNLPSSKAEKIFKSKDYFVDINGQAWLPVETTMFGRPFLDSLKEGRESLEKWSGAVFSGAVDENAVRIVFIENAWKKYPSAQIDESIDIELPESKKIFENLEKDIDKILGFISKDFRIKKKKTEEYPKVSNFKNQLGVMYAKYGVNSLAEKNFLKAIEIKKDNFSAYNNLGNIYLLNGKYTKAIKHYKKALKIKPGNKGTVKNLKQAEKLQEEDYK